MYWKDEGFLLSKNNFDENSIIVDVFTQKHGKYTGIIYGGSSRKQKKNFQIGNKILVHWKSKGQNRNGYFSSELIKPISPLYFDDKKKTACILSSTSILKILLPDSQKNEIIYKNFESMIESLNQDDWIKKYIYWELSLISDLGYEIDFKQNGIFNSIINEFNYTNNKDYKIPKLFNNNVDIKNYSIYIKEALFFNKNLLMENFIIPNKLRFPLFRNILEKYYQ